MPVFTENANFAVDDGKLYIREGHAAVVRNHAPNPAERKRFTPPLRPAARYTRLTSNGRYFLDCLVTAEDLATDTYPNGLDLVGGIRTRTAATHEDFGASHAENITLAKKMKKEHADRVNTHAAPSVGQAYVIVSVYTAAKYPYHAAGVIAEDGNSRVTLEVFASGEDASSRTFDGTYEIYSVASGSGETFHDRWWRNPVFRAGSGATPPVTLVIEPR
ncbi:MAG TPA: hypothetical protein VF541_18840 [Longimicrobium sp.]|jgi:hypothetical protein